MNPTFEEMKRQPCECRPGCVCTLSHEQECGDKEGCRCWCHKTGPHWSEKVLEKIRRDIKRDKAETED